MGEKAEKTLTVIFYSVMFTVLAILVLQNLEEPWPLVLLSGILFISFTIRNANIYGSPKYRKVGMLLIFIDAALVFIINQFDKSGYSHIYYFILIGDSLIAFSYKYSIFTGAICFLFNATDLYSRTNDINSSLITTLALNMLAYISVFAVMSIAKYEIQQREKIAAIMYELKFNKKQLENAYQKLTETSEELEDLTALRERNRIAREIHDTVGHTLTTVLLEIEAGERLLNTNGELALEKFGIAKEQVRKGLSDIRDSVKTLKAGRDMLDLEASIKLLINDITKHGDVFIRYEISNLPQVGEVYQKALYRALQEGITNGIKHGRSTAFVFRLSYEDNVLRFLLQDNGDGTDKITPGFGLTGMEERIRELGGEMVIQSKQGEGFCISIDIPFTAMADGG